MLVMSRSPGQSLVFGEKYRLTLVSFEYDKARVLLGEISAKITGHTKTLRVNEPVEVFTGVRVTFLQPLADGVRLGLDVLRDMPVYRGEIFDAAGALRSPLLGRGG